MKKILFVLMLIPVFSFSQYTAIPDENFEQALIELGYDKVTDGKVLTENIDTIYTLKIAFQYISDLTSWCAIGARTVESQLHRQLVSGLSIPTGFKNSRCGDYQNAINAMISAQNKHSFIGINNKGNSQLTLRTMINNINIFNISCSSDMFMRTTCSVELTDESIEAIFLNDEHRVLRPTYQQGTGPVTFEVVDPMLIPKGDYLLTLENPIFTSSGAGDQTGLITTYGSWVLTDVNTGKVVTNMDKDISLGTERYVTSLGFNIKITQSTDLNELNLNFDLSKIFKNGKIEFPINIENHMIEKLVEGTRNEPPFMMYT